MEKLLMENLVEASRQVRRHILRMVHRGEAGHLASALSVTDILVSAYWGPYKPLPASNAERDFIVFSKGHAVSALYAVLALKGVFPENWLDEFNVNGGKLPEQPAPGVIPGIEFATGSLGHGLAFAMGAMLAARIKKQPERRALVVMSDGECEEGSVWEAAMLAGHRRLNRLTAVIDKNGWQATGRTVDITGLDPLGDKWRAFGWEVSEVDGHDLEQLSEAMQRAYHSSERPYCIVANTVKGKGVSFMEDDNNWHYRVPNSQELESALRELA